MHVLDNQHHGLPGPLELIDRGGEYAVAVRALRHRLKQCAANLAADIGQRSQRLRRGQRIARAPKQANASATPAHELPDEGGLADPSLTGNQHDAAATGLARLLPARQLRELSLTLEKRHDDCLLTGMSDVFPARRLLWVRRGTKMGYGTHGSRSGAP